MSCDVIAKTVENTVTVIVNGEPVVAKINSEFVKALVSDPLAVKAGVTQSKNFVIISPITGSVGPAGSNGQDGNTILNGVVDPTPGDGVNGDFFINTATFYIFGPKAAGVWPTGTFLGGSKILTGAGAPAPALQGDSYLYIDTTTGKVYYKVTGSWIDTGLYFHISTSTLPEGTNLYFTDARARTAAVQDAITDGVTNIAPSQNAVFDALTAVYVAIAARQPLDSTLTALAAFNSNGIIVQTAPDTFAARSIQGTASQIDVADGDGVAANPVIGLSNFGAGAATYVNPRSVTVDAKGRVSSVLNGDAPEYESVLSDDFITGLNSSHLGWLETRSGTNAFSTIVASGSEAFNKAQGCLQLSTGTTASGRSASSLNSNMGINYTTISQKWRMWLPSLSDAANEYSFMMGFGDTPAGAGIVHTDEISFAYDRLVSSNWLCKTTKAGVTSQTITAIAVNPTTFNTFQININAAGTSVSFIINGVTVATHALNIPGFTEFVGPMAKISKSVGTTARVSLIDYFWQKINWAVAR